MDGGGGGAAGPTALATSMNAGLNGGMPPPFLSKTYDMVDDPATDAVVSWGSANNSFVVWDTPEFARHLLPKFFKHNNFSSFVRQLNTYGFRKVDPDRWEFANEGFLRGQKHLLMTITRRKPSHSHGQQQQQPRTQSVTSSTIEVGNYGMEEEIERLKRDKNVLMQELVRLRQQQQASDHQLKTLGQRLQGMEQRQQQMMSFLAKAIQSPGFFSQLVQQNNSNRLISGVNRKRRLPRQDNKGDRRSASQNGQIIKYQPLINEAAKTMLMQILNFDTSLRLEPLSNSENFLIEKLGSPLIAYESGNALRQNSGVTLSEVPMNSDVPFLLPECPAVSSSSSPAEIPSSSAVAEMLNQLRTSDTAAPKNSDNGFSNFSQIQGALPNEIPVVPANGSSLVPDGGDVMDNNMCMDAERFSSDTDMEILHEDEELPDINDPFWEQFLAMSPLSGDAGDVDSTIHESMEPLAEIENGWDSSCHLGHLPERIGDLKSDTK